MDIQELEKRVRCLQCEAQDCKIHDCPHQWGDKECERKVAEAYLELIGVWDGKITP